MFVDDVKNETSKIKIEDTRLIISELAGYVRTCSQITLNKNNISLDFYTENASVARRIFTFIRKYSDDIKAYSKIGKKKSNTYILSIDDEYIINELFYDTDFIEGNNIFDINYDLDDRIINSKEEIQAYIRAVFLGAGYISNPSKSYHLEIQTGNLVLTNDIIRHLNRINILAKTSNRKGNYFVYIKESDRISDFLVSIGANQAMFKFEDNRALKDIRNNVNRLINFETANIEKTVKASMRHINDINYLIDSDKFDELDDDLKEVAKLRVNNADASLKEVANLSNKYSKAAINYRLNKISKIANKLRGVNYD